MTVSAPRGHTARDRATHKPRQAAQRSIRELMGDPVVVAMHDTLTAQGEHYKLRSVALLYAKWLAPKPGPVLDFSSYVRISYGDPTGNQAVRNVDGERRVRDAA